MSKDLLRQAIGAYTSGRVTSAETLVRQLLVTAPGNVDALNLLALICCGGGRLDDGITVTLRVLELDANNVQALETLGDALHMLGEFTGAAEAFRRAAAVLPRDMRLQLKLAMAYSQTDRLEDAVSAYDRAFGLGPVSSEHLVGMAVVLATLGRHERAVEILRRAVGMAPSDGKAWSLLGEQLRSLGKTGDALSAYGNAVLHCPDDADAHYNRGLLLNELERHDEAAAAFERAIDLRADFVEAHTNLGCVLHALGRFADAAQAARRATTLNPRHAKAYTNLGNALADLGDLDGATEAHRRAVSMEPDFAEALVNLGLCLIVQHRPAEGLAALERAVEIAPDKPWPQFNFSTARLRTGDFARGWEGYRWRWETRGQGWRKEEPTRPLWDGATPPQGRVLVTAEQGVGDEIMFAGLLPDLLGNGVRLELSCDPRLMPLFARSFPGLALHSRREKVIADDVVAQLPCGDLPRVLRPDLKAGAWLPPGYLRADGGLRDRLRRRYGAGPLVGLSWFSLNRQSGHRRSIPPHFLRPLMDAAGPRWVSLQYGTAEAVSTVAQLGVLVDGEVDQMADLDLFAAQVDAMDAVVTIDNSTAHMAGALGKPTLLLLPYDADWRWFVGRDDCPWYPSVRLIRQSRPGDWAGVIDKVTATLSRILA